MPDSDINDEINGWFDDLIERSAILRWLFHGW